MVRKTKGHNKPLSELHFISDVPLEEAVVLLQAINDLTYTVRVETVDSDLVAFAIDDTRFKSKQSKLKGTLQRWQGTDTRLDAMSDMSKDVLASQLALYFLGVMVAFLGITLVVDHLVMTMLLVVVSMMLLLSFLSYAIYHDWEVLRETSLTQGKGFRQEREYLVKRIITKFHEAGSIHIEASAESDTARYETKAIKSLLETIQLDDEEETYPSRSEVQPAKIYRK